MKTKRPRRKSPKALAVISNVSRGLPASLSAAEDNRYPGSYGPPNRVDEGVRLRDVWTAISKRRWMIVLIVMFITTATAVMLARKPDIFLAERTFRLILKPSLGFDFRKRQHYRRHRHRPQLLQYTVADRYKAWIATTGRENPGFLRTIRIFCEHRPTTQPGSVSCAPLVWVERQPQPEPLPKKQTAASCRLIERWRRPVHPTIWKSRPDSSPM